MRRSIVRLAAVAAALAFVLSPHSSTPQVAPDDFAAHALLATNVAQTMMHPPRDEDTNFFIRKGGVPNIFFLVDSSGSMERLPPNGPAFYGGANPTMPPGAPLPNPSAAADVTAALAAPRTVGCGLDAVSKTDPLFAGNEMLLSLENRRFYPPCGNAVHPEVVGAQYGGPAGHAMPDYADESSVCPYYTPSNSSAVDTNLATRGGFDPDYYDPQANAAKVPTTLWVKGLVYHDSVYESGPDGDPNRNWARNTLGLNHNFGNGWTARTSPPQAFPYKIDSTNYASIDQFCTEQGTTALPNGQIPADVCKQCLRDGAGGQSAKGWYYDGFILQRTQEGIANKQYPSIWYSGNYLNFFPPKFMIMKKIVKDVVATQSKIRMALAVFGADGMAWKKEFNPTCAHPESNFDSNRSTYVNLVDSITFQDLNPANGTPLANALFDIGRYYHSPDLPWFGASWEKTGWSWESTSNSNDYAICYQCQTSSVIVLTDGLPSAPDGTTLPKGKASRADALAGTYAGNGSTGVLPNSAAGGGIPATDCPECDAFTGTDDYKNNLTRVAWYLHNYDLRDNGEATKDCRGNGGIQTLDIYTVGYATQQLGDANRVLASAANSGGGIFVAADNPLLLKSGINAVFEEINGRSTSFSVATVSTLQTTAGHAVVVPRFDPAKGPFWAGHLFRYELYSEFVNECSAGNTLPNCCTPFGVGDYDCDGQCLSVFLQDAGDAPSHTNPYFVQEAADGIFYRNAPNAASCSQAPMCAAGGKTCGALGTNPAPAKAWWDAGEGLAKKSWKKRTVFTVVDGTSEGGTGARDRKIDGSDAPTRLDSSNDTAANAIRPYLGNKNNRVCATIAAKIETAGDAVTATLVRTNEVECAKTVVRWVLGADVFNEAHRGPTDPVSPWPPPPPDTRRPATVGNPNTVPPIAPNLPDQERLGDRPYKLGDIFHSSPVVVDAPLSRTGILCNNGLHNQCLMALWRAPSGDAASDDDAAYDAYVNHYHGRRKVILVGTNEGVLHAFNGGAWHEGGRDDILFNTSGLDTSKWPFNGYYDRSPPLGKKDTDSPAPGDIWAEELWAFLPPDMIAKLPLAFAGEHQLMVDGSAMVRDVWVDGTSNGMSSASTLDDVKDAQEFHTVAVVGERRGGTHYFALDVSNATKLPDDPGFSTNDDLPKFLWMYPQPSDRQTLTFGETYTDFLPGAPPVGPVRIEADAVSGDATDKTPKLEDGTLFHERWIAFLSGGYDASYVHGRGVHMVDVYSGREYFDFSYPEDATAPPAGDPRWHLRFPVPATVGMVAWGPEPRRQYGLSGYTNQGFFDTATFGDTGGQLWVLRFNRPGKLDSQTKKATNWFGARAFQMGGGAESLAYGYPFFYLTANTALPDGFIYRAYIGSGDRFNILDRNGGVCSPDNLRACAMRGCNVEGKKETSWPELTKEVAEAWEFAKGPLAASGSSGAPSSSVTAEMTNIEVASGCPSPDSGTPSLTFNSEELNCSPDDQGRWGCDYVLTPTYGSELSLSNTTNAPVTRNWYTSVRVFDDLKPRIPFKTAAEATEYDKARLWIRDVGGTSITQSGGVGGDFAIIPASSTNPPVATRDSAGWAIYYDHDTNLSLSSGNVAVNALDERTSTVSSLIGRVISWSTLQPGTGVSTSTTGSCFASKCTGGEKRVAWDYGADPLGGGIVLRDASGNPIRATVNESGVPPQGKATTVSINQKGEVLVGLTVVNPERGASSIGAADPAEPVTDLGWMEVSKETHACRHASTPPDAAAWQTLADACK